MSIEKIKPLIEEKVNNQFNKHGAVEPVILIASKKELTAVSASEYFQSEATKDVLKSLLDSLAKIPEVDFLGLITEGYFAVQVVKCEGKPAPEQVRDYVKEYKNKHGSVRNMPGNKESVILMLWTRDRDYLKVWHIEREPAPPHLVNVEDFNAPIGKTGAVFENPFLTVSPVNSEV